MSSLSDRLIKQLQRALTAAFPEHIFADDVIELTLSTQEKFGHYQCNSAMKLAKVIGKNPREIAARIVEELHRLQDHAIKTCEIAGPGFINITLAAEFIATCVETLVRAPHFGITPIEKEKIIIDFSSPNIAKEMHVGHLRSTIIGDCLARVFEFLGADVLRLNHIGDWGTAFGMLIAHLKTMAPEVLNGRQSADATELVQWYREAKKRFDEDAEFKQQAQRAVVLLQQGDPAYQAAWKQICDISRVAYQEIYDLLDIQIIERGESFYNPYLSEVVTELEQKGLVTLSDGAKCIFPEGFKNREGEPLPFMIQKSDGGFNYASTDLAALRHRTQVEKAQRIIIVTDAGQSLHFQMLFQIAEKAGYFDSACVKVDHVAFGLVLGPDGKKFRTRAGEVERLIDLLSTAISRAKALLMARDVNLPPEQLDETAHILGINAIKYADLSCHRTSDYTFSYDRMLRFEGNTAAFLMYAYVRIAGIKRKIVNVDMVALLQNESIQLLHPSEIVLGLQLAQFPDMLHQVARDLLPHRLSDYLFVLAEKFNLFFRDCRVEGAVEQNSRLLLCETTAMVLRQGMLLLGLKTVQKM